MKLAFITLSLSLSPPESPTVTFGLEKSSSFATFAISNNPGANFNLSFFIRTLKPTGLVFQIINGTETCLALYLADGQLQVEASVAAPISIPGHLADGRRHFVMLSFHEGFLHASLLNREEDLGPLKVTPLASGSEIHVGGLLDEDSVSLWGGYFKGCLQDVRLNHHQMKFFPPKDDRPEGIYVKQTTNVFLGCISDDTCKVRKVQKIVFMYLSKRMAKLAMQVRPKGHLAQHCFSNSSKQEKHVKRIGTHVVLLISTLPLQNLLVEVISCCLPQHLVIGSAVFNTCFL